MLALGSSVQEVSDKLAVPHQTIVEWRAYLPAEIGRGRLKKEVIEELFGQYLEKSLRATLAQLEVISDPDWIRTQNAADLATLHGVVFDKSVRVFDAARRGAEQRQLLPAADGDAAAEAVS